MVIFVILIFHKLQILADWNRAHAKLAKFSTLFKSHAGGISEKLGVPKGIEGLSKENVFYITAKVGK